MSRASWQPSSIIESPHALLSLSCLLLTPVWPLIAVPCSSIAILPSSDGQGRERFRACNRQQQQQQCSVSSLPTTGSLIQSPFDWVSDHLPQQHALPRSGPSLWESVLVPKDRNLHFFLVPGALLTPTQPFRVSDTRSSLLPQRVSHRQAAPLHLHPQGFVAVVCAAPDPCSRAAIRQRWYIVTTQIPRPSFVGKRS